MGAAGMATAVSMRWHVRATGRIFFNLTIYAVFNNRRLRRAAFAQVCIMLLAFIASAQDQSSSQPAVTGASPTDAPITLTLQDALQRAKANSPDFQRALTELGLAHQDKVQGRSALLPSANFNGQFLYSEGNGSGTNSPKYIANNGVHEYVSQGNLHQTLSFTDFAEYKRTAAAESVARARAEIASRGLVLTVVQTYYGLVVAQSKYAAAQKAAGEAERFLDISQKLEHGGEVAHSDVVKATIQTQQQRRELQEAQLAMERARLDLAVLLFPDFNQNFSVIDDLQTPQPLPGLQEAQTLAANKNPELRVALATVQEAHQQVLAARGGLLPSLGLDYWYGIDANHLATKSGDINNLGYSAAATLQFPIWNWGANISKVKQADLRQRQARVELSFTQRQLVSNLLEFYGEARTSRSELESLNQSADLAADSLRLTSLRYQAGEATVLEVVDAQNTLTQARNAYDDGKLRYRVALASLQTLTGNF
jgi:outer membrane protein TolC